MVEHTNEMIKNGCSLRAWGQKRYTYAVEVSCSGRRGGVKNALMDSNLASTAVEATTRVLILEVAVILTALMAALATVIVAKVKRLKISK